MNIAFTFNIKRNHPSTDLKQQVDLEFDSPKVINTVVKTLTELGHKVHKVEATDKAYLKLKKLKDKNMVDLVFTIAEGLSGDARESQIAMFCEVLQIPYTHSSPSTHAITLDKQFTKWVLQGARAVKIPESQTITKKDYEIDKSLDFPLIVKPNKEGSSKGIMDANVVKSNEELGERIEFISENFTKEIIVEEYIEGREFTVSVLGNNGDMKVLPIVEQTFDFLPKGMNRIASLELKYLYEWDKKKIQDICVCPAKIDKKLENEIIETSKQICKVLDIRDAARIDYRLDEKGDLYFLEVNTLPGLNPDPEAPSYYIISAEKGGLDFKALLNQIIGFACKRFNII
jgi:D-alanine-D-alanine ligase